ncbi:MAG: MFS transporter, partial [Syntrophorhabdales bacterium]
AYPVAVRGTGTGWAYGVAKIGGVFAPAVGGFLLSLNWGVSKICFWQATIGLFVAAVLVVLYGRLRATAAQAGSVAPRPVGSSGR